MDKARLPVSRREEESARDLKLSLCIAFCTRNRPDELLRAVQSVIQQASSELHCEVDLLIVDDGDLENELVQKLRVAVEEVGWVFSYLNKRDRPGLFRSRLAAIEIARSDIILFLDDDVEVAGDYLRRLTQSYAENKELAALGGVDLLTRSAPRWRRIYERMICYRSFAPGRLSVTSYGGSMDEWAGQSESFATEYMYGCNMSFRTAAVATVSDCDVFEGHASGEDVYLSFLARQAGEVRIDPRMCVRHYQSPLARDRMEQVFYRQIVNHYHLMGLMGASRVRRVLILWTAMGLIALASGRWLLDVVAHGQSTQLPRVKGGLRGFVAVVSWTIGRWSAKHSITGG